MTNYDESGHDGVVLAHPLECAQALNTAERIDMPNGWYFQGSRDPMYLTFLYNKQGHMQFSLDIETARKLAQAMNATADTERERAERLEHVISETLKVLPDSFYLFVINLLKDARIVRRSRAKWVI